MPANILNNIRLIEAYEVAAHAGMSSLSDASFKQCRGAAQCGASVGSVLAGVFPWATGDQTDQAWFSDLSSRFTGASLHATTRTPCVRAQASKLLCISVLYTLSEHQIIWICKPTEYTRTADARVCSYLFGLMPSCPCLMRAQAQAGSFCSCSAQVCCQLVCCLGPGQATSITIHSSRTNLMQTTQVDA